PTSSISYQHTTAHHAAGVLRSGHSELYIDGGLVAQDSGSITTVRTSTQTVLGQVANDFVGDIDEVRVYSRALAAAEILSMVLSTQAVLNHLEILSASVAYTISPPWMFF